MKRGVLLVSILLLLALVGLGVYLDRTFKPRPPRITTGPFKLVLAEERASAVQSGTIDTHDTEVTVVIDYQGARPAWWGKAPYQAEIPDVQVGGSRFVDEHGKAYQPPTTVDCSRTFDNKRQQYIWTYNLNTTFVPATVHHLAFKSQIIHPTGTLQVSVPVRDAEG